MKNMLKCPLWLVSSETSYNNEVFEKYGLYCPPSLVCAHTAHFRQLWEQACLPDNLKINTKKCSEVKQPNEQGTNEKIPFFAFLVDLFVCERVTDLTKIDRKDIRDMNPLGRDIAKITIPRGIPTMIVIHQDFIKNKALKERVIKEIEGLEKEFGEKVLYGSLEELCPIIKNKWQLKSRAFKSSSN